MSVGQRTPDSDVSLSLSAALFVNNGNDAMATHTAYSTGLSPQTPTVGDFNGDGKKDIAVTTTCPKLGDLITGKTCLAVLINQS